FRSPIAVLESEDVGSLEVETLSDAVAQRVSDAFVDVGADSFQLPGVSGVGECIVAELLDPARGDGALACGQAPGPDVAADVAGLLDEPGVDLGALGPAGSAWGVGAGEPSGCFV